jgi:hypothetical protein
MTGRFLTLVVTAPQFDSHSAPIRPVLPISSGAISIDDQLPATRKVDSRNERQDSVRLT